MMAEDWVADDPDIVECAPNCFGQFPVAMSCAGCHWRGPCKITMERREKLITERPWLDKLRTREIDEIARAGSKRDLEGFETEL